MDDLRVASDVQRVGGRTELICGGCGYGVVADVPPTQCPMCRESSWRFSRGTRRAATEASWARE
jgi:rubrerythrin